jgi:hypothetical protein
MIPIEEIHILNPRHRDKKKFEVIVQSIKTLGLKDADPSQPASKHTKTSSLPKCPFARLSALLISDASLANTVTPAIAPGRKKLTSAESLVNAYRRESQKQKLH